MYWWLRNSVIQWFSDSVKYSVILKSESCLKQTPLSDSKFQIGLQFLIYRGHPSDGLQSVLCDNARMLQDRKLQSLYDAEKKLAVSWHRFVPTVAQYTINRYRVTPLVSRPGYQVFEPKIISCRTGYARAGTFPHEGISSCCHKLDSGIDHVAIRHTV